MNPLQKRRLNGLLLGSSCLVASAFMGSALAGNLPPGTTPTGGNVVVGNAKITDHGKKIVQTSEKAFIDWNSFSIGSGETVHIKGPNQNAVTVNRVTGVTRSEIDGALRANDNVWLLNGNGILFGKGSIINVGSLIATTSDLSDDDFRKGKYTFKSGSNPNASVINKGTIKARDGGTVILSAAHVANEGVIQANMGSVVLGGANAFTVDFNGDNLIRYQITSSVKQAPTDSKGNVDKALVSNSGRIVANGGTVVMTSRAASNVQDNVINNSGMIEATSVSAHDGEVDLDAGSDGTVNDSGTIDVSGTQKGTTGGNVTITGQTINVTDGARIEAHGQAGGGTVLIGGDFHGQGTLQQSQNVTIGKATINVSATQKGDGGKVAIWSKGQTIVNGHIDAQGGRWGGNGGYIETSGDGVGIGASALVNTSAQRGAAGMWLLDPTYVTIENCGGSCCGAGLVIDSGAITTSLTDGTDVTIEAEGGGACSTITVAPNSSIVADGSGTLSLLAEGNITIESSIQNSGTGGINLVAGWDGTTGVTTTGGASETNDPVNMAAITSDSGAYGNNGGTVTIGDTGNNATIAVGAAKGATTVAAANLVIGVDGNVTANDQLGFDGNGGGDIDIYVSGDLTVQSDRGGYAHLGNGNINTATQSYGDIFIKVGGTTDLQANVSVYTAWIGNTVASGGTATGNVTLETGALDLESVFNSTLQTNDAMLGDIVASDLTGTLQGGTDATGGSGGGNVTLAITGTGTTAWGDYFGTGLDFANGNTLSLLSKGAATVASSIQAVENGNINIIAGWDGTTGLGASDIDVSTILSTPGAFGHNGGDVTIGGSYSDVSVGSQQGTTTVAARNLTVGASGSTYTAQLGYAGNYGGDIHVALSRDLIVQSARYGTSRIGNGGFSGGDTDVSGDITIKAASVSVTAAGDSTAQIGNWGSDAVNGNISITTSGDVTMSAQSYAGSGLAAIGNNTEGANTTGDITLSVGGNLSMTAAYGNTVSIGSRAYATNINITVAHNITMATSTGAGSYGSSNYVIIGNYGGSSRNSKAGGNINVTSKHGDITMYNTTNGAIQIGNGPAGYTSGNIAVTAKSGNIDLTDTYNGGIVEIGNGPAGSQPGKQITGNISVTATNGNITLTSEYKYSVTQIGHGLASQVSGNITVTAGGDISLAAEDKYAIAIIGHDGAYGSTSGNIKVAAGGAVSLYATNGSYGGSSIAQIGNGGPRMGGNASGNIVVTGSSLTVKSGYRYAYATIGNGDPWHNSQAAGTGRASGNITLNISGLTTIDEGPGGGDYAWIGNEADPGSKETGNVTLITGALDVTSNGTADGTALGDIIVADLGTSSSTGGDFTLAFTGTTGASITGSTGDQDIGDYFAGGLSFDSPHSLSFLSENSLIFTASVQNSGTGDINAVAGWDGTTGSGAAGIDVAAVLASSAAYGNNNGNIVLGGTGANTTVSVGTFSGETNVAGHDVDLDGTNGDGAQIGYLGGGAHDDIFVRANGNVSLNSYGGFTQIGNGGPGANGNNGGNITITATGTVSLDGNTGAASDNDYAQIGNGGLNGNDTSGQSGSNSGNITITVGSVSLTAGDGNNDYAQIGNGGAQTDQASGSSNSGDILITTTSGGVTLTGGSSGGSNEQNDYAQIGMGGPFSGSDTTNKDTGNITVHSAGNVTLTGGTDADEQNGFALIGDSGTAKKTGNITVTAAGNITVQGGTSTGNPDFNGIANSFAQIGDTNSGAITGNVSVTADGNLTIRGGNGDAGDTARVGDTSSDSAVIGNVAIVVGGTTFLESFNSGDAAGFGDSGSTATGTTLLDTGDLALSQDELGDFGSSLASDLNNGNVTIEIEDKNSNTVIAGTADYDSANTLKILGQGSLDITGSIQNAGDGAIYVIGGWDGSTTSVSQLTHAGVYGNNNGNVTIGGTVSAASVGSEGGTTTVAGDNILVNGQDGIAQIGWHSSGGGNIVVDAIGNVTVNATSSTECYNCIAIIGNGGHNASGDITGNITITTAGGSVSVNAPGTGAIATIGDISNESSSEDSNIFIDTNGGAVTLTSSGGESFAQIGNWLNANNDAALSGNITIDAGAVTLDSTGQDSSTQIGNGNFLAYANNGTISGNIDIHATTVTVEETAPSGGFEEARIGNLGDGVVTGNVSVTATGDVLISATGAGAADIGDYSNPHDSNFAETQGEGSGNVTVNAGGNITLTSTGAGAFTAIEFGGATDANINVTAHGDVIEDASGGGGSLIGTGLFFDGGANVTVTATDGNITLQTEDAGSTAQIGNIEYMTSGVVSGNIKLKAGGDINLLADGSTADAIEIGDEGGTGGTVSGNLTLTAGGTLDIENAASSVLGNQGAEETGNVSIRAAALIGDITPSIENDLPGGNFSVVLTGNTTLTLSSDVDVDSAYNLTLSNGGNIMIVNSLLNSGSGDITIDSSGNVLIGGSNATGAVAVGSAGGTTKVEAANLTISGVNGDAQLGFNGAGGGNIVVDTTGALSLSGSGGNFAQIGDGSTFESNAAGGNVTLSANAVSVSGKADIVGDTAVITIDAGNVGSAAHPLDLVVNSVAVDTGGGNAYLTSPDGLSIGVGSKGIDLHGGDLVLSANGPVTQTSAIDAGSIDISGSSITLKDAANRFDSATLTASGNASLFDALNLTIAGANVGGTLTLAGAHNIDQSGAIDAGSLVLTANHGNITLNNTGNDFAKAMITASGNASIYDSADLNVAGANVGGTLSLSSGGNIAQTGAIDAGVLDAIANNGSITLTDDDNAVSNIVLSAGGDASFYDTLSLMVNGATVGGNLTLLSEHNLTFVSSVQLTHGNILAVAGWDGTTTGAAALEAAANSYGNNNGSITIGGAHATGNVSVGSKTGTTTMLGWNVVVEAEHGNAQLGYAGAGSGDIFVDARNGVGAGSNMSGAVGQIGNGGADFDGSVSGNITIDGKDLVLVALSGGIAQIGNGGADASGTAGGDITINVTGTFEEGALSGDSQVQLGNGGYRYDGDASGNITIAAGSALIADEGDDSFVMIGNGGDLSQGNNSGNISLTAAGNITAEVLNGTAAIQIGNGGFTSNGSDTGDVTVRAGGNITLATEEAGTSSYIQIGDGGSMSQGGANGAVSVTAANISLTTDNQGYIQIGNGGSEYDGNTAGAIAVSASNDILADVDMDGSYIQIGNGGFDSNGNDSGNIALTAGNDLTLETTDSAGGTATSGSYLQVGNGGDGSNENSAHGFSETGNIAVRAKTIELSAGDNISGVHIGNGGTCAGAAGSSNNACSNTSNTTTHGSIAFGGNIKVTATTSLSMTASGTNTVAYIGNGGNGAASGATATGSMTDSGNITVDAGNIVLAANETNGFALIGNFGPDETGAVTIDAKTLTGDLAPSMGNDLGGGDFTVDLTGNQALTIGSDFDYASNHTLSLTDGGDIVFDASVQNAGSGAIDITSTGGDILIGGSGASGDVAVGSKHGSTTLTADNITLAAVNGFAQVGFQGASGGDISIDASGAVTLAGGNNAGHTAQIGNGSHFDTSSAGGAIDIAAASIAATGHADIAGDSADIAISGTGGIGSASNPLALAVNALAIETQGGNVFATSTQGISIGVGADGIDLNGGDFSLTANGAVSQTQAIEAGAIDIGGTTITLSDSGNSFADATLSASGDAAVNDKANLTIASADIGGTLTLTDGKNINQSGAIVAGALDVTAGKITLNDSGNNFAKANLTSAGDTSLNDSANLTITGADVGGTLKVVGGKNISQSGAITAVALSVIANGSIALNNSGNSFGTANVSASGDASLSDGANLTIAGADIGGTLTLIDGKNINQTGAIVAGALDVTANKITLSNAGNTFAKADVTASGNASLFDASNLVITGADVGGSFTLIGGGNIGQTGAIASGELNVTATNGSIALTNTANSFASATVTASGDASLSDSSNLTITSAGVGGTLTLTGAKNIGQTGAITASALKVASKNGSITLTNGDNSFAKAAVTAAGNASLVDSTNLTVTSANVGGTFAITGAGNIGQTGAITAGTLNVAASNGSIALTNSNNSIADASLTSSGDASLSDASSLTITGADVGGTLTLASGGNIGQTGAITAGVLDVTSNGQISLTNSGNSFADADLQAAGSASLYDASNLVITGANVGGTLTLAGGGNIGQSGAIAANALHVTANHGSIALTNAGNNVTSASLTASGNASLTDSANLTITGATVEGTLTLADAKNIGESGAITAKTLNATANGSIELTGLKNAIGTATLSAGGDAALFDTSSLTVDGASAGGNLTLLAEGDLTFVKSVQLDNGNLIAVAGWNGKATDLADLTHAAASDGGTIVIGGSDASGNVAVGSQHGTTTLIGDNVSLEADNGYAQIGYNGAGSGNIDVIAAGNVTLGGGASAGDFAQIGNGGMGVSGNQSGDITVDAGGVVSLEGGKGQDAYAQIGHGGADADKNSSGYTNTGNITILGQTVALAAGAGNESYAQIGQGGFEIGAGLTGKGTNEGNITLTVTDGVTLSGGDGNDSYSQIGNGGDQSNKNASSGASGSDIGNVTVDAGSGTVDTTAGSGTNAYTQIGNGGFDANDGGNPSNFTMSGNISVSDLTLLGSDTGTDAYAQVGNGDASENSTGNAAGDIVIDAGSITVTNGAANGGVALIGNATGHGLVSGIITGYTQPNTPSTDDTQGTIESTISTSTQANTQQVDLIVITPPTGPDDGDTSGSQTTGPLGNLSGNTEASGDQTSDAASNDLGRSLNGHDSNVQTVALIPGVLTEVVSRQTPRGIPPADQNFSSWGNEALWRW